MAGLYRTARATLKRPDLVAILNPFTQGAILRPVTDAARAWAASVNPGPRTIGGALVLDSPSAFHDTIDAASAAMLLIEVL